MTCQECEIKLGMGEDAGGHLASCAECRALAEDLRLNSMVLREMRVRPGMHWGWALAAAATIVGPTRTPVAPVKRVRKKRAPVEPLRVKMFTSDPDVVIYWIVDKKEGYE